MTTYTEVFGGTNIYPSDVSYLSFNLNSTDVTLAWPLETNAPNAAADYEAARIMDVNSTGSSRKVYLPEANQAGVGECFLFNNVGTTQFTVVKSDGTVICSILPGTLWQVYLISNTTVAGSWVSYQFGSTTSTANAGALAGYGLKAITTTLNQAISILSLNSNYQMGISDRAHMINWVGSTGTLSFTSAVTLGSDWFVYIRNSGDSAITIDPSGTETIDGSTTLPLNPGESAMVITDGVSFYTVGLGKSAIFVFDYTSFDVSTPTPYVLSGFELNRVSYDFTGVLSGNQEVVVPTTVQQYWVTNNTSGPYTLTVKTASGTGVSVPQNGAAILYCNGTDVVAAQTLSISIPVPIADGGTGATSAGGALINLGGTAVGTAVFTATDEAAARTAINAISPEDAIQYIMALG